MVAAPFEGSKLKIARAEHHIADLATMMREFTHATPKTTVNKLFPGLTIPRLQ